MKCHCVWAGAFILLAIAMNVLWYMEILKGQISGWVHDGRVRLGTVVESGVRQIKVVGSPNLHKYY